MQKIREEATRREVRLSRLAELGWTTEFISGRRIERWLELGILAIPDAYGLSERVRHDRAWSRRVIAHDDWLARCRRKRRVSVRFRRIAIARARGRCVYCGIRVRDGYFEIDHVRPVRWGGRSTLRNLVAACGMCNRDKGQEDGWEPYSSTWRTLVAADAAQELRPSSLLV